MKTSCPWCETKAKPKPNPDDGKLNPLVCPKCGGTGGPADWGLPTGAEPQTAVRFKRGGPAANHTGSGTSWCGPAAISVITGRSTEEISQLIRATRVTGTIARLAKRSTVKGIHGWELDKCLDVLGVKYERLYIKEKDRPTLASFLDGPDGSLSHRAPEDIYILNVTGHFLTVRGDIIIDNNHPTGIAVAKFPNRRVRVKAVYEFDPPWRQGISPCNVGPLPEAALVLLQKACPAPTPSQPKAKAYGPQLRGTLADLMHQGATRQEIAALTGWLPHSVRGWLSRLGKTYTIEAVGDGAARCYRVLGQRTVNENNEIVLDNQI